MLNIEKYKGEILEDFKINNMEGIGESIVAICEKHTGMNGYFKAVECLEWLLEEYKEPLLEDFEITLIKSFLDIVTFETVYKRGDELDLENEVGTIATIKMEGMFEKLEDHKRYTLEELEIWQ